MVPPRLSAIRLDNISKQSGTIQSMSLLPLRRGPSAAASSRPSSASLDFESLYEENLTYTWRAARRLGVEPADLDDVVQEVFVVAHRKLAEFEGRASARTWLFKILMLVVRHHRRSRQRKPGHFVAEPIEDLEIPHDHPEHGPAEAAERAEAIRILDALLAQLDVDKREVFVLAEIEQLSSVEIAEILEVNLNTVYSPLRVARQEFQQALTRFQARELGRQS